MSKLANHVAIVTGAASGIGREIARQLSQAGAGVALLDLDGENLRGVERELSCQSDRVSAHTLDIGDEDAVKRVVADAVSIHGRISIVINNAAITIAGPFETIAQTHFDRVVRTNFGGAVYVCRHTLPLLKVEGEAHLVNVASDFATLGFPGKTAYCASKAALVGFSYALYTELFETNVRVSIAIPPAVQTNLVHRGLAYDPVKQRLEADIVARHAMPVNEVAGVIINGMMDGELRITMGWKWRLLDVMSRWFPTATHRLIGTYKSKITFV